MEITFTVAATACAAVVMFWALFTVGDLDDSSGGGGGGNLLGIVITIPIAAVIIIGLVVIVPAGERRSGRPSARTAVGDRHRPAAPPAFAPRRNGAINSPISSAESPDPPASSTKTETSSAWLSIRTVARRP